MAYENQNQDPNDDVTEAANTLAFPSGLWARSRGRSG